jgi:iron complex outermembrane receptor protein
LPNICNAAYQFQNSELYAFGGYSNRNGATAGIIGKTMLLQLFILMAFYQIHSKISDISAAVGLRGKVFETWNYDLSNTYGKTHLVST